MSKIVYILAFVITFALVTGGMIFLNNQYENIFAFDFSPPKPVLPAKNEKKDSANVAGVMNEKNIQQQINQKLENANPAAEEQPEENISASKIIATAKPVKIEPEHISKKDIQQSQARKANVRGIVDSNYIKWKYEVVKLYEAMDSKKAAKILEKFSDNVARDVLFAMKKKKAAEVISELNPETASRLIKVK